MNRPFANGDVIHSNHGAENDVRLQGKVYHFMDLDIFCREQFKSYSVFFCSNETQENDEETNISQEILVLDFGDEKSEFLRSGGSGESDFNGGKSNIFT